jgi:hypothetical protein
VSPAAPKKKRGRPRKLVGKYVAINTMIPAAVHHELARQARKAGKDMADIIRDALGEWCVAVVAGKPSIATKKRREEDYDVAHGGTGR